MKKITTLIKADIKAWQSWFSSQFISKLFVLGGFFLVFASVFLVIFAFSRIFFRNLTFYDLFGLLTANYILHAAILVIFLFAVGSSAASTVALVSAPSDEVDYLLTLPIESFLVGFWLFLKSSLTNLFLLFIVFFPIVLSYALAFLKTSGTNFLVRFIFVLVLIVVASNSLGAMIGFLVAPWFDRRRPIAIVLSMVGFLVLLVVISRAVLPQSLIALYRATPSEFVNVYNRLPLSNQLIPTLWLTKTIIEGLGTHSVAFLFLTTALVIVSLEFQRKKLAPLIQRLKSRVDPHIATGKARLKKFSSKFFLGDSLVYKDWLSVVRSPAETSYIIFLFLIALSFFLFLSRLEVVRSADNQLIFKWGLQLTLFTFFWILFFVIAFFLRVVFPLMTREGKSAWYLFTLPIKKERILSSKVDFGAYLSIPAFVLSTAVWLFLPFVKGSNLIIIVFLTSWTILIVSFVQSLSGAIFPNFEVADEPEKISTSTMGILALFLSGLVVFLAGFVINAFLKGIFGKEVVFTAALILVLILLTVLFLISRYSLRRYQF